MGIQNDDQKDYKDEADIEFATGNLIVVFNPADGVLCQIPDTNPKQD